MAEENSKLTTYVDIVFDGPPGPESGRFVEVEDASGKSIRLGEWLQRPDGSWALRIPAVGAGGIVIDAAFVKAATTPGIEAARLSTASDDAVDPARNHHQDGGLLPIDSTFRLARLYFRHAQTKRPHRPAKSRDRSMAFCP